MDRLIIRDKRYIINDMKNNLVNGEVMLTLLQDFRPLRKKKIYNPSIDKTTVNVGVNIINGAVQAEIDVTGTGAISATPSIITEDSIVEIELPPLTGEIFEIISEQLDYIIDESGTDILANEEGESELIEIPVTYTFQNGDTEIDYIEISRA
jgi:molybdopterin-binding protein